MIQLKCRSEFSFRTAFGPAKKLVELHKEMESTVVGITDRHGTFGHIPLGEKYRKAGIKPLYGVELATVLDASDTKTKQPTNYITLLARNSSGLEEIYKAVELATGQFYYVPRIDYVQLNEIAARGHVFVLLGQNPMLGLINTGENVLRELHSATGALARKERRFAGVPVSDNFFMRSGDRKIYELLVGKLERFSRTTPMHILDQYDMIAEVPEITDDDLARTESIANECNAQLTPAKMVVFPAKLTLRQMCEAAAPGRSIDLSDEVYQARLTRELNMINDKKFHDYFYVLADMIQYAKQHMLVGPARGSSCGSLVCYLLGITDIDPIPHDLLFERFIDVTRKDLPDIDVDFQDDRREMVFDYLRAKYGKDCVARLGTVSRYQAKSLIGDVAKELEIPPWETTELKGAIIERSSGDARAAFCLMDTFETLDVGKRFLAKYPAMAISSELEQHARHTGQHAAGMVVTAEPLSRFCAVDARTQSLMLDKEDAERINLLKIDALGLRTLSVLGDCLRSVGWSNADLLSQRTDDEGAFRIINQQRYAGIFQFEGDALQSLARLFEIDRFTDIAALTALARPGPLHSGAAVEWVNRRVGKNPVSYLHPMTEEVTKDTYGLIIYQEQVMRIAREVGRLSWEDVSTLRKAMSKSFGREYFDQFYQRFRDGARTHDISDELSKRIWDQINVMGSWSFNKSHAIAYGLVSYQTALMKSKFPMEFAAATLRHPKDEDQSRKVLRELHRDGRQFRIFHKDHIQRDWVVKDNVLYGGITNIKGIGGKMADDIVNRLEDGRDLTAAQVRKIEAPETPYDNIFECQSLWGHILANPGDYNIMSPILETNDIHEGAGEVLFFAKIAEKNLRDVNEEHSVEKRGGKRLRNPTKFINLRLEDDTGLIMATINRHDYIRKTSMYPNGFGHHLIEEAPIGTWIMWKGEVKADYRKVYIKRWVRLDALKKVEKLA